MVPSIENGIYPLAIVLASLAGSLHCVAMCGGIVSAVSESVVESCFYQVGRLVSYLVLGALAGYLGGQIAGAGPYLSLGSSILMGGVFIYIGISLLKKGKVHFSFPRLLQNKITHWFTLCLHQKKSKMARSYGVGMLSGFLPCGWLHGYVVAAIALSNPISGAFFLFLFWLGTLPSLQFAPLISRKILSPLSRLMPNVSALVLLFIGIGTIIWRVSSLYQASASAHCH